MDAVTKDTSGNLWVYFGTGNETDPTFVPTNGTTDKFFGIVDKNPIVPLPSTALTIGNLKDVITKGNFNPATDLNTYSGWYINLATAGEKVLAEATVFAGLFILPPMCRETRPILATRAGLPTTMQLIM